MHSRTIFIKYLMKTKEEMGAFSASGNHDNPNLVFSIHTHLFIVEASTRTLANTQVPALTAGTFILLNSWQVFPSTTQPPAQMHPPDPLESLNTQHLMAGRVWGSSTWLSWGITAITAANSWRGNSTTGDHILGELFCLAMDEPGSGRCSN